MPFTQAVITVPSVAREHCANWVGRRVAVAMGVGKGVFIGTRGGAVLNAPPVIVVNMVGIGVGVGIPSVGVGDGMGVAARSARTVAGEEEWR